MTIHNHSIPPYAKSYTTEFSAITAVNKLFPDAKQYDLFIIIKNKRHVPIIQWKPKHQHRIQESIYQGFYSI